MIYEKNLKKISRYVETYFQENKRPVLTYHNLDHTRYVVSAAKKIAAYDHLSDDDLYLLLAAAWFHDIGYIHGKEDHEETGIKIARTYLEEQGMEEVQISRILDLIRITQRKNAPADLLEEIILDADTFHVGKKSFMKKSEMLRKETELSCKKTIPRGDWYKETAEFLEKHQFYTIYSNTLLADQKAENLYHLKATAIQYNHNALLTPANMLSKNTERADKTIDTAFRIASQNNQRLSSLADNKAHILITVNSIILSAIISLVLRKLSDNNYLIIPTFLLLSISLATMVLAIITTRPTVSKGTFSKGDIEQRKINLLFFGNYFKMLPEEYTSGMWMMLDDKVYIYNSIMLDIYYQGAVIGRKYHFLRLAYNIFMWGLVIAVLAFCIAAIIHNGGSGMIREHAPAALILKDNTGIFKV